MWNEIQDSQKQHSAGWEIHSVMLKLRPEPHPRVERKGKAGFSVALQVCVETGR